MRASTPITSTNAPGSLRLADDDVVLGTTAGEVRWRVVLEPVALDGVDDRLARRRRRARTGPGTRRDRCRAGPRSRCRSGPGARASPRRRCRGGRRPSSRSTRTARTCSRSTRPRCAMGTRPPRLDTLTTQPRAAGEPVGEQRERHAHRRVEVDVHHVRDVGRREARHRDARRDAGVVHQAVDARRTRARPGARARRRRRDRRGRPATRRDSGVCTRHSASTSSSRSARRATSPTVAPRAASIGPSAAPMPDDAPVTTMFEPSICTSCPPGLSRTSCAVGVVDVDAPAVGADDLLGTPGCSSGAGPRTARTPTSPFVPAAAASRVGRRAIMVATSTVDQSTSLLPARVANTCVSGAGVGAVVDRGSRLLAHVERLAGPSTASNTDGRNTSVTSTVPSM